MILAAWYHVILAFFFAVACFLLMVVILLQRGRGVGIAGAFGGAGGASATFGAKTGDFLTWVTIVGAGILLVLAVILNYVFVPQKAGLGPPPTPVVTPPAGGDGGAAPTNAPTGGWNLPQNHQFRLPQLPIFGEPTA